MAEKETGNAARKLLVRRSEIRGPGSGAGDGSLPLRPVSQGIGRGVRYERVRREGTFPRRSPAKSCSVASSPRPDNFASSAAVADHRCSRKTSIGLLRFACASDVWTRIWTRLHFSTSSSAKSRAGPKSRTGFRSIPSAPASRRRAAIVCRASDAISARRTHPVEVELLAVGVAVALGARIAHAQANTRTVVVGDTSRRAFPRGDVVVHGPGRAAAVHVSRALGGADAGLRAIAPGDRFARRSLGTALAHGVGIAGRARAPAAEASAHPAGAGARATAAGTRAARAGARTGCAAGRDARSATAAGSPRASAATGRPRRYHPDPLNRRARARRRRTGFFPRSSSRAPKPPRRRHQEREQGPYSSLPRVRCSSSAFHVGTTSDRKARGDKGRSR